MLNKQLDQTILLVDDDPVFLKGIMYTVKSLGFKTLTASGAKEAVLILQKEKVDVVLSDINMPDGNGIQLLKFVLKHFSVPVILMTGFSDLNEAHKALDMGARNFLTKPFRKEEISEAIQSCFAKDQNSLTFEDMTKIHLDEFIHGKEIKYPIYLYRNDILVKVSNGGEALSADALASYWSSGITFLCMKKADYIKYVGYTPGSVLTGDDRKFVEECIQRTLENLSFSKKFNALAYERVSIQMESTLEVLLACEKASARLLQMVRIPGLVEHSSQVAVMSCLIGQYLGNVSPRDFFDLCVAALFGETTLPSRPELSKVLQVAGDVSHKFSKTKVDSLTLPHVIKDFTIASLGKMDLMCLEALNLVFKFSTPEEFVDYQLNSLDEREAV